MSAYIGIGGGVKSVSKMYVGVDGKAHQVQKAYIGVNGVAKLWYQRGTPLGNYEVGSIVKINVNGTAKDFIIVHQGIPDAGIYDASCNGTWVLMKDIYIAMKWDEVGGGYSGSDMTTYLNGTFYNLINPDIRNAIKQVKIPYGVHSGANGLSTKVFLLSGTEVGFSKRDDMKKEGAKLAYFDSASKRIAYNGSSAVYWWLRSPYISSNSYYFGFVWLIDDKGAGIAMKCTNATVCARPAFVLPQDVLVDDTGHIIGADDPRTPLGWLSVGSTVKMDINGNKRVWRIAYKGNPNPDIYDSS